jgi:hypothetical protein
MKSRRIADLAAGEMLGAFLRKWNPRCECRVSDPSLISFAKAGNDVQ